MMKKAEDLIEDEIESLKDYLHENSDPDKDLPLNFDESSKPKNSKGNEGKGIMGMKFMQKAD